MNLYILFLVVAMQNIYKKKLHNIFKLQFPEGNIITPSFTLYSQLLLYFPHPQLHQPVIDVDGCGTEVRGHNVAKVACVTDLPG